MNLLIIGGDKRMKVFADSFDVDGVKVCHIDNAEKLKTFRDYEEYTHIVLPLPSSKDGRTVFSSDDNFSLTFEKLTENLCERQIVFGGNLHGRLKALLDNKKIQYYDFMENEDFLVSNAFLTAQGALKLLLENTEDYLVHKKALIIGFGRVAVSLAALLCAVGTDIYIAARNAVQLENAEALGYKAINLSSIDEYIPLADFIFGSVPARVLSSETIALMRADAVYFELASAPFTADEYDFKLNGKKYVSGAALPGRYLPVASGRLIADYMHRFVSAHKE